jgi:ketoreductase RED1
MSINKQKVAVIGAGVIGSSWAALFSFFGHDVYIYDKQKNIEEKSQKVINYAIKLLSELYGDSVAAHGEINYFTDLREAVSSVNIVQENGPDDIEFKEKIFKEIFSYNAQCDFYASSSSSNTASNIAKNLPIAFREKFIISHPFNPPHMLPLVEISSSKHVAKEITDFALSFYESLNRCPILLKKEIPAFIGNRLQGALNREAFWLVQQGVATIDDIDAAMTNGLGIRWAVNGPFRTLSLGTSDEYGIDKFFKEHGQDMVTFWQSQEIPELNDEFIKKIDVQLKANKASKSVWRENRDRDQLSILKIKK